jgi:hypothetical protein
VLFQESGKNSEKRTSGYLGLSGTEINFFLPQLDIMKKIEQIILPQMAHENLSVSLGCAL